MATTNQGWALPTVGGSQDTWGSTLNTTIQAIDTLVGGVSAAEIAKLDGMTASQAELNKLTGVTWSLTGFNALTATVAELNYVDGVTSAIQTQLNGKEPVDAEILRADTDDNLTAGYTATADNDGTISSGTYTPSPVGGNLKRIVNGGAFTLAAPTYAGDYTMIIQMTNNATAGTITATGFTKASGDPTTTTNGHDFLLHIVKINNFKTLYIEALQ
jgi:hypothetical protein